MVIIRILKLTMMELQMKKEQEPKYSGYFLVLFYSEGDEVSDNPM